MNKILAALLISASGFAGIGLATATPAAAASASMFCDGTYADIDANKAEITQRLAEKGIDATSIEEWNGCVRAFVQQANGSQTMVLLDPHTLQPVADIAHV